MAWNQPDNNGYDRDPWGRSNNSDNSNKHKNKGKYKQRSPNLDDIFRKINRKLNTLSNKSSSTGESKISKHNYYIILVVSIIVIIWASSGFYTLKEAECGVVLRFGKFDHLVQSGLNWKPTFIDTVIAINVKSVRELITTGMILTSDENIVHVKINVQYRVTDPKRYLFSVANPDNSLRQVTDSVLHSIIGQYTIDQILTENCTLIRSDTQRMLKKTIQSYNMGITLLDINFQATWPPEELQEEFNDVTAAKENKLQCIRKAVAYSNKLQSCAKRQAQRILEEGRSYKTRAILEAQAELKYFAKVLPEYKAAPEITRERLCIHAMERVLSNTKKILIDDQRNNNLIVLPIDQKLKNQLTSSITLSSNKSVLNLFRLPIVNTNGTAINQPLANAERDDITYKERE
ncbi:Modulator of FtsH protease HflK [Candidatus Gullanella endobia]|uniref:Protein HflK n=1 Tax=Candidatus Gullanella endobia TaxID=1070130 RepID=A0A143WR24_9ENTR|nr:FtsH protease activity modulator HflK [Candidatus Gullanella endobia]CUX96133.1 Modulator of FtsH protease HflK [Candidatus Gullanella endobia]